ncbi:hypothetical protein EDC01DRAFT_624825 [Geopyxis carbonaria]|nr:hypothetical protein EDC01DRAFT_624825 [Geopyxis carbonaria]
MASSSSSATAASSFVPPTGNCAACAEPLYIPDSFSDDDDILPAPASSTSTFPSAQNGLIDDVELPCGCHFHYACLEDSYPISHHDCPFCGDAAPTAGPWLVVLRNEGGEQRDYDLGAALAEEAFMDANPDLKRARAFLEFVAAGDREMVREMLATDQARVLAGVRDEEGRAAVHVAVENGRRGVLEVLVRAGFGGVDGQGRTWEEVASARGVTAGEVARVAALAGTAAEDAQEQE